MLFVSTRNKDHKLPFDEAIFRGLADDGGLYFPEYIPELNQEQWNKIKNGSSISEVAFELIHPYTKDVLSKEELTDLLNDALNFEVPLVKLSDNTFVLELFHGPTLAFKDVGARFMARAFSKVLEKKNQKVLIVAATSGDTGSAVAQGFYNVPNVEVCLLFPKGKVSPIQEKQLTTVGANVTAVEIDGVFDDCQKLVKQLLSDPECKQNGYHISTANSINIARLIPQSVYYAWAWAQLGEEAHFVVPSGNFGNITAGLLAKNAGMPAKSFIAATNANDVFPHYYETGLYEAKPSIKTISNAMDVGAPSNFERLEYLFNFNHQAVKEALWSVSVNDLDTKAEISKVYKKYGYTACPHTAVGIKAAELHSVKTDSEDKYIILSTAHPAKFGDIVEEVIQAEVEIPSRLAACLNAEEKKTPLSPSYTAFKAFVKDSFFK